MTSIDPQNFASPPRKPKDIASQILGAHVYRRDPFSAYLQPNDIVTEEFDTEFRTQLLHMVNLNKDTISMRKEDGSKSSIPAAIYALSLLNDELLGLKAALPKIAKEERLSLAEVKAIQRSKAVIEKLVDVENEFSAELKYAANTQAINAHKLRKTPEEIGSNVECSTEMALLANIAADNLHTHILPLFHELAHAMGTSLEESKPGRPGAAQG